MSAFTQTLVARFGPPSPALYAARSLPIRWPDYKDLPPTVQLAIARQQQAEQQAEIARYEAADAAST
jgi:hypothetical protein